MGDDTEGFDDRFEKIVSIGSGSMGTVYKAWDRRGGMHVALKLLHRPETAERFEREARVLSQIDHPNIVRYLGHGVGAGGRAWLAMEWLEGGDLESYLGGGALRVDDTLRIARAIAAGLAWAHA